MSKNENPSDFKIKDVDQIPNRYICFVKIKIYNGDKPFANVKGSGVLIDKKFILTAAHNFIHYEEAIAKLRNMNIKPIDKSYIKLALHEGNNYG
jgi:hypothetical protein